MSLNIIFKCEHPKLIKHIWHACGVCPHCRRTKYFEWALRCRHELMTYNGKALFFTLTYKNVPLSGTTKPMNASDACGTLNFDDTTLFLKRLRKHFKNEKLRYIYCGEYGPNTWRPHYHFIVFGLDNESIDKNTLKKLWSHGHVDISKKEVTDKCIQYVLGYIRKKIYVNGSDVYLCNGRIPPQCRTSKGIGKTYALKNMDSWTKSFLFSYDNFSLNIPRYYLKLAFKLEGCTVQDTCNIVHIHQNQRKIVDTYTRYKIYKNINGKYTDRIIKHQVQSIIDAKNKAYIELKRYFSPDYIKNYYDLFFSNFINNIKQSYKLYNQFKQNPFSISYITHNLQKSKTIYDSPPQFAIQSALAHNSKISNGVFGKRDKL
nr:MAG: replication initiator protein [Microvirus sp.]